MKKLLYALLLMALLLPVSAHASMEEAWSPMYTVAPTCTEPGYTVYDNFLMPGTLENRDFVPAKGHSWGDWQQYVYCEDEGLKQRQCSVCGTWESETLPPRAIAGTPAR